MSVTNGWTPRRRKQAACNARKNKPWKHSTGPRTEEGKAKVSKNAITHGNRIAELEYLRHLLHLHRQYLKRVKKEQQEKYRLLLLKMEELCEESD